MQTFFTSFASSVTTVALLGILGYLTKNLWLERLKHSLQKEHTKFLDHLQWERKAQEQGSKVAEYLSVANQLKSTDDREEFRRANQLSWELAMWLPEELYYKTVTALAEPDEKNNVLSVIAEARKYILKDKAGNLTQDNIAQHAPEIGSKSG